MVFLMDGHFEVHTVSKDDQQVFVQKVVPDTDSFLFDLHHLESGKICNFIFISYVAQLHFIFIVREFFLLYF